MVRAVHVAVPPADALLFRRRVSLRQEDGGDGAALEGAALLLLALLHLLPEVDGHQVRRAANLASDRAMSPRRFYIRLICLLMLLCHQLKMP